MEALEILEISSSDKKSKDDSVLKVNTVPLNEDAHNQQLGTEAIARQLTQAFDNVATEVN